MTVDEGWFTAIVLFVLGLWREFSNWMSRRTLRALIEKQAHRILNLENKLRDLEDRPCGVQPCNEFLQVQGLAMAQSQTMRSLVTRIIALEDKLGIAMNNTMDEILGDPMPTGNLVVDALPEKLVPAEALAKKKS